MSFSNEEREREFCRTITEAFSHIKQQVETLSASYYGNLVFGYSGKGQLSTIKKDGELLVQNEYDNLGRLTKLTRGGVVSSIGYDSITNRLSGFTHSSSQGVIGNLALAYNELGLINQVNTSGNEKNYSYSPNNFLTLASQSRLLTFPL